MAKRDNPPDLSQIPSKAPPLGIVPDFSKRSPLLDFTIAVSGVFLPLMFICLGVRLYIRISRRERWMMDDTMAVVTAISATTLSAITLASAQKLARHSWDVSIADVIAANTQKSMVAQHIFNSTSLLLGKFCLLTMYYRIFGHITKVRWQLISTAILTLPLVTSIVVLPVLVGPQVGKPWGTPNPLVEKAVIPNLLVGINNMVVDICIFYIPIPIISRLNLSKNKKNGIKALFATGLIAVITDIVGLYFRVKLFQRVDQLLYGYVAHNCALIESTLSVILSSLPSMAKLWRVYIEPSSFFQSLRTRLSHSRLSSSGNQSRQSLPSFIKNAIGKQTKGPRDPYTIDMPPTTNLSQLSVNREVHEEIELTQKKHGVVSTSVQSIPANLELRLGEDIHRCVSVEQTSAPYRRSFELKELSFITS